MRDHIARKKTPQERTAERRKAEKIAAAVKEAERFVTVPGRESGAYCGYWDETIPRVVHQHASWRHYQKLWERGYLEWMLKDGRPDSAHVFNPDARGNPPNLPGYWAADVLAYVEACGRYEERSFETYHFDWRENRPTPGKAV